MLVRTLSRIAATIPDDWKHRLPRLRNVYLHLLQSAARETTIVTSAGAFRWVIDELTSQRHLFGTYEPYMQECFQRYVTPGSIVYDIGAHAGYHTLFCGLLVGPRGRVLAFEPNPVNLASIQEKARLNPALPITCLPYALGDYRRRAKLSVDGGSSQGVVRDQGQYDVEVRTIDDLAQTPEFVPPDLLKIDVEGLEEAVLRGAQETLAEHQPIVLIDRNDDGTFPTMRAVLEPLGYTVEDGNPIVAQWAV